MFEPVDHFRTAERSLHAVFDALLGDSEGFSCLSNSSAKAVFEGCLSNVKQLYTLVRHRAHADVDAKLIVNPVTGLPTSVEIAKVRQDVAGSATLSARLTAEKAALVEHILDKREVPAIGAARVLRTAYYLHASKVDLEDNFWFSKPSDDASNSYWSAWFQHQSDGQFVLYLMRFDLVCEEWEKERVLERLAHLVQSGSLTSPGIFGARLDESFAEVHPKEVHAWFVEKLIVGDDFADVSDSEWSPGEFLASVTYEQAISSDEQKKPVGLFGSVTRQVWETGGSAVCQERLIRRQKKLVVAPHSVLQRMNQEVALRSLRPIVASAA